MLLTVKNTLLLSAKSKRVGLKKQQTCNQLEKLNAEGVLKNRLREKRSKLKNAINSTPLNLIITRRGGAKKVCFVKY